MYKSTSSSISSQSSMGTSTGGGLTRYGSAPGSFLTTAVDSVIGAHPRSSAAAAVRPQQGLVNPYFSSGDSSVESSSKIMYAAAASNNPRGLQRSYGSQELALGDLNGIGGGSSSSSSTSSSSSSSLMRQRSSPAGFFSHLAPPDSNGFSVSREGGNYGSHGGPSGLGVSRLKPQLSFTRQDSLSQISEASETIIDGIDSNNARQSYGTATSFGIGSWDATNTVVFSSHQNKRPKNIDPDMFDSLNVLDSQFNLPANLEMASMEKLLHIPEDSVPCKIRAKRGCATHPRSIAERERRTRISGKLKKLQELVPNMDKQTSYADMLDLAVQHIKGLQNQIENLHKDLENCACGCK